MLPLYNQELWVSMKAGITASTGATPSTGSAHYSRKNTASFLAAGATSGATITYLAYEPSKNKIHIMTTVST